MSAYPYVASADIQSNMGVIAIMREYEIAVESFEDASRIADVLLNNEYVVLLSREERLWIINYEYVPNADRNKVVFMNREEFDCNYYCFEEDEKDEECNYSINDIKSLSTD